VAIFIALNGSAVAAQVASEAGEQAAVKQSAEKAAKKKAKRGPPGPAGPQGPAGPPGGATGAAGGELAGNYPNPTIGTVDGLNLAVSTQASPGVEFGPGGPKIYNLSGFPQALIVEAPSGLSVFDSVNLADDVTLPNATVAGDALDFGSTDQANLYRSAANILRTDDSFGVGANVDVDGNTTLGNATTDSTVLRGDVNLPDANSASDALFFSALVNLYRDGFGTLRTDDIFRAPTGQFDERVELRTFTGGAAPPDDNGAVFIGCSTNGVSNAPALMVRWPDSEVDVIANDNNPESTGNTCP
jgi:hypothetical protein